MKSFRLIVAGGRDFADAALLAAEVTKLAEGDLKDYAVSIVSGMAKGADKLAWEFAQKNNIKCTEMPANWDADKKRAGYLRNEEMAKFADGLLAFWDGSSKGAKHMIKTMEQMDKPVRVVRYGA